MVGITSSAYVSDAERGKEDEGKAMQPTTLWSGNCGLRVNSYFDVLFHPCLLNKPQTFPKD